jgi:hypothetical protein
VVPERPVVPDILVIHRQNRAKRAKQGATCWRNILGPDLRLTQKAWPMSTMQRVAGGLFPNLLQRMRSGPALLAQPHHALASLRLFRVVTIRGDLLLGISTAELAALGPGPDLDRLARRFATQGQVTGWLYHEGRGLDGAGWLRAAGRVSVLEQDALTLQPHDPGVPLQPPPANSGPS